MNKYDPQKHHRRSIRLKDWDYRAAGYYFVTICSFRRENAFGAVVDGAMVLSDLGEIVREEWLHTAVVRAHITLDEFIIMPNHLHGILVFDGSNVGVSRRETPTRHLQKNSLGAVINQLKSIVTKRHNKMRETTDLKVWQRGYYERIVRNERELNAIREYIRANPARWAEDRDNLDGLVGKMNGR